MVEIKIFITNLIETPSVLKERAHLYLLFFIMSRYGFRLLYIYLRLPSTKIRVFTYKKPYRKAPSQTISQLLLYYGITIMRWIKQTLAEGEIAVEVFSAHGTRHPSTAAAAFAGVCIDVITTAGWSGQNLQIST